MSDPLWSYVKYLTNSGSPTDLSAAATSVTNTSVTSDSTHKPFTGSSLLFNGTSSKLALGSGAIITNQDFSIDGWVYQTSRSSGGAIIWSQYDNSNSDKTRLYITSGGALAFTHGGDSMTSGSTIPLNTWTFFELSVQSGTAYMLLNGVFEASTPLSSDLPNTTAVIGSGAVSPPASSFFAGNMSPLRITIGAVRNTDTDYSPPTDLFPIGQSYDATGTKSTTYGVPSTVLHATGRASTFAAGHPYGANVFRATGGASSFRSDLQYHPYTQTCVATGYQGTQYGETTSTDYLPAHPPSLGAATGVKRTAYGVPTAAAQGVYPAASVKNTAYGTPSARAGVHAAGTKSTAFGAPKSAVIVHASGVLRTGYGTVRSTRVFAATGCPSAARYGVPSRGNVRMAYGLAPHTGYGVPQALNGRAVSATGTKSTSFGTPAARDIHRVAPAVRSVHYGTPLLNRGNSC